MNTTLYFEPFSHVLLGKHTEKLQQQIVFITTSSNKPKHLCFKLKNQATGIGLCPTGIIFALSIKSPTNKVEPTSCPLF